jgi:hypothetical protein
VKDTHEKPLKGVRRAFCLFTVKFLLIGNLESN